MPAPTTETALARTGSIAIGHPLPDVPAGETAGEIFANARTYSTSSGPSAQPKDTTPSPTLPSSSAVSGTTAPGWMP